MIKFFALTTMLTCFISTSYAGGSLHDVLRQEQSSLEETRRTESIIRNGISELEIELAGLEAKKNDLLEYAQCSDTSGVLVCERSIARNLELYAQQLRGFDVLQELATTYRQIAQSNRNLSHKLRELQVAAGVTAEIQDTIESIERRIAARRQLEIEAENQVRSQRRSTRARNTQPRPSRQERTNPLVGLDF